MRRSTPTCATPGPTTVDEGAAAVSVAAVSRDRIDQTLVDQLRALPGVAAVEGEVLANGIRMVGKDGKVLGTGGRGIPSRGTSWRTETTLNPFKLAAGNAPVKDDDVVIDKASSETSGLGVGDQNAIRNPRRTAGTAAALLIGVAVVSFFAVIASSLTATTNDQIDRSFVGDIAITGLGGRNGGFSPALGDSVAKLPEVDAVVPIRLTDVPVNGQRETLLATDPVALGKVLKLTVTAGSISELAGDQVAVADAKATERTREIGLLRAVGASRPQIRSMVRWEAVIIALLGTLGGTGLGIAFGWAIIHGLGQDNNLLFSVPVRQAVVIILLGGLAGIIAALRPASTASKLNILQAVGAE